LIYKQILQAPEIHRIVVIGLQKEKPGTVKNAVSSRLNKDLLYTAVS